MKNGTFRGNTARIAATVAITFSSSPVWAQSHSPPAEKSPASAGIPSVTFVVEHARPGDVAALTESYEKQTGLTVVPVVVSAEHASQLGLTDSRSPSAMNDAETGRYSQRELATPNLANFEGGDAILAVSLTTVLVVALLVVLLIILL